MYSVTKLYHVIINSMGQNESDQVHRNRPQVLGTWQCLQKRLKGAAEYLSAAVFVFSIIFALQLNQLFSVCTVYPSLVKCFTNFFSQLL